MTPEFSKMVIGGDEAALEDVFFNGTCSDIFNVDWREVDSDIVDYCSECLGIGSLTAKWSDANLLVTFRGKTTHVPLREDFGDRHLTVCALNDLLSPDCQIRYLVISNGCDTAGFAALWMEDWRALEAAAPATVAENFIDPRKLPNVFTELTEETLPPNARARYRRMLERNRRR